MKNYFYCHKGVPRYGLLLYIGMSLVCCSSHFAQGMMSALAFVEAHKNPFVMSQASKDILASMAARVKASMLHEKQQSFFTDPFATHDPITLVTHTPAQPYVLDGFGKEVLHDIKDKLLCDQSLLVTSSTDTKRTIGAHQFGTAAHGSAEGIVINPERFERSSPIIKKFSLVRALLEHQVLRTEKRFSIDQVKKQFDSYNTHYMMAAVVGCSTCLKEAVSEVPEKNIQELFNTMSADYKKRKMMCSYHSSHSK